MNIAIDLDRSPCPVSSSRIEELLEFALAELDVPPYSEISISFVGLDEMAELNGRYRGLDGPTDVLSFECDNLDDDFPDGDIMQSRMLGDIVISPEVAIRQSREYGTTIEEEIDLLCVHGILHLLGYDHVLDDEAEIMEDMQRRILDSWGSREQSNAW